MIRSYEHIDPALIGNTRHVLISDLAGRSNIVMKARELGFDVTNDTPQLRDMLSIKELEHQGYEFEAADGSLALLIRQALATRVHPFVVEAYHVAEARGRDVGAAKPRQVRVGKELGHGRRRRRSRERLDSALRAAW